MGVGEREREGGREEGRAGGEDVPVLARALANAVSWAETLRRRRTTYVKE